MAGKSKKPAKSKKRGISKKDRWDKFSQEYVIDFDRARAYKAAGYKVKSDQAARNNATRLMRTNEYVFEKIAALAKGQEKRAEKSADDITKELEGMGFAKLTKSGLIKASDKIKALELLGKRFGLYPNNVELSGKGGKPIPVQIIDYKDVDDTKPTNT